MIGLVAQSWRNFERKVILVNERRCKGVDWVKNGPRWFWVSACGRADGVFGCAWVGGGKGQEGWGLSHQWYGVCNGVLVWRHSKVAVAGGCDKIRTLGDTLK